jgi:hypothetical protein
MHSNYKIYKIFLLLDFNKISKLWNINWQKKLSIQKNIKNCKQKIWQLIVSYLLCKRNIVKNVFIATTTLNNLKNFCYVSILVFKGRIYDLYHPYFFIFILECLSFSCLFLFLNARYTFFYIILYLKWHKATLLMPQKFRNFIF